jgi:four helix bundle protein
MGRFRPILCASFNGGAEMARDHRRLRVFNDAHQLVLAIYRETRNFPRDEWFGLRAQMRRASVSVASNLVEGSARRRLREYVHFVNVSRGSAAEVAYLISLASELGFLSAEAREELQPNCDRLVPQLESLVRELDLLVEAEHKPRGRT